MSSNQKIAGQSLTSRQVWQDMLRAHTTALGGPGFFNREDQRYRYDGTADMGIISSPRPVCWSTVPGCAVIEASLQGMSLYADRELSEGARVTLLVHFGTDQARLRGVIKHCRRVNMWQYRLGIRLRLPEKSKLYLSVDAFHASGCGNTSFSTLRAKLNCYRARGYWRPISGPAIGWRRSSLAGREIADSGQTCVGRPPPSCR